MEQFLAYLLNGLSLGAMYALIAVGYTMVYGVLKLINFAHGEFYMLGAYIGFAILWLGFGVPPDGGQPGSFIFIVTLLLSGLLTGLLAVAVERLCYRPLRKASRVVALLAALGVSMFLQNAGQNTVGPNKRKFPPTIPQAQFPRTEADLNALQTGQIPSSDLILVHYVLAVDGRAQQRITPVGVKGEPLTAEKLELARTEAKASVHPAALYEQGTLRVSLKQLWLFAILGLVAFSLYWIVQKTRFGRAMRAASVDFEAARLMGIDVNRVVAGTFFIGAFVAGIGGVLTGGMFYENIDPLMGSKPSLMAFVAAVLGGIGSIPGALLGALILGIVEQLIQATPYSGIRDAISFSILIVVLLFRPGGLLGKFEGEKV